MAFSHVGRTADNNKLLFKGLLAVLQEIGMIFPITTFLPAVSFKNDKKPWELYSGKYSNQGAP